LPPLHQRRCSAVNGIYSRRAGGVIRDAQGRALQPNAVRKPAHRWCVGRQNCRPYTNVGVSP